MIDEDWVTEVDENILEELAKGPRTKGAIVDATDHHRNTVYQHLKNLRIAGEIEFIHEPTKLYQLVDGEPEDDE